MRERGWNGEGLADVVRQKRGDLADGGISVVQESEQQRAVDDLEILLHNE